MVEYDSGKNSSTNNIKRKSVEQPVYRFPYVYNDHPYKHIRQDGKMRKVLSLTARTRLFLVLGIFILTAFLTHTGNIGNASENNADSTKDKKPKTIEFTLKEAKVTSSGTDEGTGQTEPAETPQPAPKANIENITADRLKQLLSLLSPIEEVKEKAFVLPEQSLVKPKLPGNIVKEKFPPEQTNEKRPEVDVKSEPLQVVRISHTGPVDTVGQFTVTFSHPMVPIGEAKHESNPEKYIVMKPMPKGTWRWLDTRTILFEPDGKRFPRATIFKVTVPEGLKSVNENVLKTTRSWELTTSAPSVKTIYPSPHSFQDVNPLIVAIFNQKIDRKSVMEHLSIKAGNSNFTFKPVDKALAIKNYGLDKISEDEWIAVRSTNPFPRNSQVVLNFAKGYQSKEGPLLSTDNQTFSFRIYGPLRLESFPKDGVSPDDWNSRNLNFNNSLDANAFQESMVTIKPAIPNQKIRCAGSRIYLEQPLEPVTAYKITFSSNLKDVYGQTLGKNVTIGFTTGVYNTQLQFDKDFVTIPGTQKPECLVRVKGSDKIDVTIFRAKTESAMDFLKHNLSHGWYRNQNNWFDEKAYAIAGKKTVKLEPKTKDYLVDLKPYIKNGYGQFVIATSVQDKRNNQRYRAAAWVQVTDLSVDAFKGKDLYTFVSALDSGKPLAKVDVTLLPHGDKGTTDKDGMIKLPITGSWQDSKMLVATRGSDQAILPSNYRGWSGWYFSPLSPQYKWYGVTDRNLYKPGESVKVKGWSRKLSYIQNESEKIELTKPEFSELLYRVMGYDGQEISHGEIPVDQSGGFDFEFKIPDKINLGQGYINLGLKENNKGYLANTKTNATERPVSFNAAHTIQFAIQEFRRPEFEMKVNSSKGTSMLFGETTRLTSKAKYFAGGSLKGSPVSWQVRASESTYSPPGWQGFRFGTSSPYWRDSYIRPVPGGNYITKNLQATADANGETAVEVKLDLLPKPSPVSCVCEATIQDVNRQSWSDKVNILVHPADTYVGVKSRRWFYRVTDPIELEFIAVDLDGKAKDGQKIAVELVRKERTKDNKENDVSVEKRELTSTSLPLKSNFKVDKGGNYELISTVTDKAGRKNETRVTLMIQDDKTASTKDLVSDKLVLIADKEEYQPGDTIELMVSSPFYPAHGLMTIRRHSIVETRPIEVKSASATFKIPVKADFYPNFAVEVYLAGDDYRFGSETVQAKVPPKERQLSLTAIGTDKLTMPGTETTINIDLKDAQGKPVQGGQVAIAVADESVLALSGYKWSDPIDAFYPQSSPQIDNTLIRTSVILTERDRKKDISEAPQEEKEADDLAALPPPGALPAPKVSAMKRAGGVGGMLYGDEGIAQSAMSAPRDMNMFQVEPTVLDERHYTAGRAERQQKQMPQVNIRTNFNALAYFKPSIYTDENGHAQVKFKLPDSLTRYRVMAIAVAGDNLFGSSESNITARMPLMIKPSAPRFLNFGDRCELPVVLQNQTDEDIAADVILRAANAAVTNDWQELPSGKALPGDKMEGEDDLSHAAGKRLVIPANNRVEVRFPVSTIDEGKANFQCAVVAEKFTDASQFSLPVYVPAAIESYATYGQVDKGAIAQKLDIPKSVFTQIGGLTISSSSTAVQALTDAYFEIRDYQFGCSEQLSSRIIAMVSLHDVLSAFGKMDALAQSQYRNKIQQDLDELVNRQNGDGSFGLWTRDEGRQQRYPYMSIQVARALGLARENDYKVADDKLELSRRYLKNIRQYIPADYPERLKRSIEARALNVRYLMSDVDSRAAADLIKRALADRIKKMPKGSNYANSLKKIPVDFVKEDLSLDSAGWLLPIVSKDTKLEDETAVLKQVINSSINETPSTASCNDRGFGIFDYCVFFSPRRTDAILMEALMETEPENPLIAKLAKGLLAHRKNGSWSGTQENGYILQAMNAYFNRYEKVTPDYTVSTWLGETLVADSTFKGRTTDTKETMVPMANLADIKGDTILMDKKGPGRLYYRIGLDYAPRTLTLKPADFGFAVTRTYEGVDNKDDAKKDENGVWHFKAGALIKTKVSFNTAGARYHVALADPLPAGAEPVNTALAGNREVLPPNEGPGGGPIPLSIRYPFWRMSWYDHQNFRDHQAEAFTSVLYSGKYDYEYQIRATTPGHYHVPPTKMEEMYSPETFGRTATEEVIVE